MFRVEDLVKFGEIGGGRASYGRPRTGTMQRPGRLWVIACRFLTPIRGPGPGRARTKSADPGRRSRIGPSWGTASGNGSNRATAVAPLHRTEQGAATVRALFAAERRSGAVS